MLCGLRRFCALLLWYAALSLATSTASAIAMTMVCVTFVMNVMQNLQLSATG